MDILKEQELVARAQREPAAFGELFDYYYPPIYGYILRRVGSVEVAQDITSEVFYKALRGLPKFQWRGFSIRSWLYRIAGNEIRSYYKKTSYTTVSLELLCEEYGVEFSDRTNLMLEAEQAERLLETQYRYQEVRALLLTLPAHYQEVLTLRFTEELKISEIARVLGKREGTVKSLLSRGLEKLRAALEQSMQLQPLASPDVITNEGQPLLIIQPQESYED